MKGQLTIRKEVKLPTLEDFTEEAFLFQNHIHLMLFDPAGIKKVTGKIPCFNVNVPGIVNLSPEAEIEPIDVEIIAR